MLLMWIIRQILIFKIKYVNQVFSCCTFSKGQFIGDHPATHL
ncbi:hypothetical protein C4J87_1592 [Pseudomonas sp. R1-43-08]|nr:hypothetical protein C4J87_1592 [Pseudomonas sp. R1-43-08]AZF52068.1 hypothetical protein C4J85_1569 [Pseudomonas sp. R4-34-07]